MEDLDFMIADPIKHATCCTRCGKHLVIEQDPECPTLVIDKWLKIIVCNRCGKYLEDYRRIDDAIAFVCGKWAFVRGQQNHEVAGATREKLTKLTQKLERLFSERWNTVNAWCIEWVDLLVDEPDKCRIANRARENQHRRARSDAK